MLLLRRSAQDLLNLVDDLLDTARVEAGQVVIRPSAFAVADLFSALCATLRPLLASSTVTLVFEDPGDLPLLHTDEARLSQILRNFIANALKFTQRGEIRVRATGTGDVGVESRPGVGSTFFLEIPRVYPGAGAPGREAS